MSIDYFFRWNGEICRKSTSGGRDVEEIYGWSKEIGQWGVDRCRKREMGEDKRDFSHKPQ